MSNTNSILVVDDDSELRRLFNECLSGAGYRVLEAATGMQGLQMAQRHVPDLVLLDVRLPDMSGVEVCRQIKSDPALEDVFVALCSGEATSDEHKVDGLQTGADEYLVKPFGLQELLARVQTLMRLRNATAALRVSEEHHRRLIDILPDAVCSIHPKGRLLTANSQAVTMLGYSDPVELLQTSIFEITPAKEHERIKTDIEVALKTGEIRNIEYSMLKKDGTLIHAELSATVSLGVKIEPVGLLVCVIRDITGRKRAEEQLRKLSTAVEQSPVSIVITDKAGNIEYVNPRFTRTTGYSLEEVLGRNPRVLKSGEMSPANYKHLWETITSGKEWSGEFHNRRKDGELFWESATISPILDKAGRITHYLGVKEEITRRKQVEESLRDSEAKFRAVFETSRDAFMILDKAGFIDVNQTALTLFGCASKGQFTSKHPADLSPPAQSDGTDSRAAAAKRIEAAYRTGSQFFEWLHQRMDGKVFPAEVLLSRFELRGKIVLQAVVHDISKRKLVETELRTLSQRIITAQEAERARIARGLHDGVNQLVASVKMRLRRVQDNLPDLKPAASEILSRCDRLLVKVLDENRRIAHNLRPTDLDQLGLAAACGSFTSEVHSRSNLQFQCRIAARARLLPPETALHLFRIVQEAVNNIEKHARAKSVKLQIQFQGESAVLKIQDDGQGFDTKVTNAARKPRHGLGLASMRDRAMSLGGTCEITTRAKQGTTILVRVPLPAAHRNSKPKAQRTPPKSDKGQKRQSAKKL